MESGFVDNYNIHTIKNKQVQRGFSNPTPESVASRLTWARSHLEVIIYTVEGVSLSEGVCPFFPQLYFVPLFCCGGQGGVANTNTPLGRGLYFDKWEAIGKLSKSLQQRFFCGGVGGGFDPPWGVFQTCPGGVEKKKIRGPKNFQGGWPGMHPHVHSPWGHIQPRAS